MTETATVADQARISTTERNALRELAKRVAEIAHMIRGDRSTETTHKQAREMLEDARNGK